MCAEARNNVGCLPLSVSTFLFIYVYCCIYVCLFWGSCGPQCAHRGQVTAVWNSFSLFTFMWVPRTELRWPELCGTCLYLLNHLASPLCLLSPEVKVYATTFEYHIYLLVILGCVHTPICTYVYIPWLCSLWELVFFLHYVGSRNGTRMLGLVASAFDSLSLLSETGPLTVHWPFR